MILGVVLVGVDLGRSHEDETGLGGQLLDEGLLDIAVGGGRVLILVRSQAVLFDAQGATRSQRGMGVGEGLFCDAGGHPGVDVAHEQGHVRFACRADRSGRGTELAEFYLPVQTLVAAEAALEIGVQGDLRRIGPRPGREPGGIVFTLALVQIRGKDFGVPAAAGPELDHRHVGLQAEEAQRLQRMAPGVARSVGCAPGSGDGPFQRPFGGAGRGFGIGFGFRLSAAGGQTQDGDDTHAGQHRATRYGR